MKRRRGAGAIWWGVGWQRTKSGTRRTDQEFVLTYRVGSTLGHPSENVWSGNCFRTTIRTRHEDKGRNPMQVMREVSKCFLKESAFSAVFYHE